jgi:TIP49 P-loop domain
MVPLFIPQAAGLVVDLIKAKKMAGRALLMAGAPGTDEELAVLNCLKFKIFTRHVLFQFAD